jgi:HD-like signal output (HDOD) protein
MPAACPVSPAFSRESLIQVARQLPADLRVLSQLGDLLQDPNSELDAISALLRRDLALAARIVRIGNSAAYGGGVRIASVEEAVNRVGFGEILKLVGTAVAARCTDLALPAYGVGANKLCHNMLYGAIAAEALARVTGLDPRVAYTAGLLRPFGLTVLDHACRTLIPPVPVYDRRFWPSYSAWEERHFGLLSKDAAAMILEAWRFPAEVAVAQRSHYLPADEHWDHPLAVLLNVANSLAARVARGFAGEEIHWVLTSEKLARAGIPEEELEPLIIAVESGFEAAVAALAA